MYIRKTSTFFSLSSLFHSHNWGRRSGDGMEISPTRIFPPPSSTYSQSGPKTRRNSHRAAHVFVVLIAKYVAIYALSYIMSAMYLCCSEDSRGSTACVVEGRACVRVHQCWWLTAPSNTNSSLPQKGKKKLRHMFRIRYCFAFHRLTLLCMMI